MKKKLIVAVAAALISAMLTIPAYAADWKLDANGWWYQYDDGSYPNSGWAWINGKCYYFTPEGYCLLDTQTPDGYTVDASGAWTVDGVVQTQGGGSQAAAATVIEWKGLTFTVPEGFVQTASESGDLFLYDDVRVTGITIAAEELPSMVGYEDLLNSMQGQLLDEAVSKYVGIPTAKSEKQFTTGTWYSYDYADTSNMGLDGSMRIYIRLNGAQIQMVMFMGNLAGLDTDGIMNNNLR